MKVKISSIDETSLVDVIGSPSFVVWFTKCNFRCPWCDAVPLVKGEGKWIEVSELLHKVEENAYTAEYVQVTGGEPTLQADALEEFFKGVHELGLKTSLDTNSSRPEVVERLVKKGLVDHYATDVKNMLKEEKYWQSIGIKFPKVTEKIKKSLSLVSGLFVEIRTTFVPSLLTIENVTEAWRETKEIVGDANFVLQQFYPFNELLNERFTKERLVEHEELVGMARKIKEELNLKKVWVRSKKGVEGI